MLFAVRVQAISTDGCSLVYSIQPSGLYKLYTSAQLLLHLACDHFLGGVQALQHRNTARQQRLRLDALRHARKQHHDRADAVLGSIRGVTRSADLAHTILKAQLQSLHQALQTLKVSPNRSKLAGLLFITQFQLDNAR